MHACVLTENEVEFRPDYPPHVRPDEVRIHVLKAGICETDLQLVQGYMDFHGVLGHEFVGIAQSGRFTGQRVCGEINCACRKCDMCRQGLPGHCPHRTVLGILNRDGAFAEDVWLPEDNLHPVPDSISDDEAVFVEPLAAAFQIPAQLDLKRFSQILVLGDGRLGNLCAQVLHQLGHPVLVIGKHPEKLALLQARSIECRLRGDMKETRCADLVIDCTGSAAGFSDACRLVRPRGTIVLKTTLAGDSGPNLAPVVIDEITVIGSRCGPFPKAIAALARHEIDVLPLISARYPLEQVVQALEHAATPGALKVLLDIADA